MPQNAENACFVSVLHKTRKNFPHGCRLQKMAGSAMKDRQEGRCRPPMAAEKRSRNRNSRPNLILSVSLACIFRFLMNKAIRLQLLPNNLQYHFLFSITSGILYFFYQIPVFFHTKSERKIMCSVFPQHPEPVHFVSHGRPASPPRTGSSSPAPCPAPGIMGQKPFPFP